MKIGQEIVITEDFEIEGFNNNKTQVKKGDKGFISSRGFVHYTTGKARGCIQPSNIEVKGYDYENIAKMICSRLESSFNLNEFLDDYEIDIKDFSEEIEDVLSDIL